MESLITPLTCRMKESYWQVLNEKINSRFDSEKIIFELENNYSWCDVSYGTALVIMELCSISNFSEAFYSPKEYSKL